MAETNPLILYENVLDNEGVTITPSTTASGYTIDSIKNRLTFPTWKNDPDEESDASVASIVVDLGSGNDQIVNTLAFTNHNMPDAFTFVTIYSSDDNFSSVEESISYTIHEPGLTFFVANQAGTFASHRYWKIEFGSVPGAGVEIGALCFGRYLEIPERMAQGFDPDDIGLVAHATRSKTGTYLGAVTDYVEQECSLVVGDAGLESSFFTTTTRPSWHDFMRTHWSHGKPFWFQWGHDAMNDDNVGWYCWPGGKAKSNAPYRTDTRRDWKFKFQVLAEGYLA